MASKGGGYFFHKMRSQVIPEFVQPHSNTQKSVSLWFSWAFSPGCKKADGCHSRLSIQVQSRKKWEVVAAATSVPFIQKQRFFQNNPLPHPTPPPAACLMWPPLSAREAGKAMISFFLPLTMEARRRKEVEMRIRSASQCDLP